MDIDPLYIPLGFFVNPMLDKDDGTPLSGGIVEFFEDDQPANPKPVFQLTGVSGNYSFVSLGSSLTLSATGTFVDSFGDQIIPYAYPYDNTGNDQLYYITVTNADGALQYTLQAQPHLYTAGDGEAANIVVNEISNPQFARVSFDTSAGAYTYTLAPGSGSIDIAPDWVLDYTTVAGGTIIVEQILPQGVENVITNPAAILSVDSTAMTALRLRQRIYGSPNLWGNGYLSGSFVAKTDSGGPIPLIMSYSQSNGSVTDEFISAVVLDATYQTNPGNNRLPISSSTQTFPNAYVDIFFDLDVTSATFITSVMVAFTGDLPISAISYDQESYARQLDHLYHYDYPIVPVGTIIDYFGFSTPLHYLPCDYAALSREDYPQLFQTITATETVTLTNGSNQFTVLDASTYSVGYGLEGTGIPAQSTITAINLGTNTITMTQNYPGATGPQTVRFFAAGNVFQANATLVVAPSPNPNQFTVADITNLSAGMSLQAFGTGTIPSGTYISSITPGVAPAGTITMSANATGAGAVVMYFYSPANGDGSTTFNAPDLRRRGTIGSGGTVVSAFAPGIGNHWGNVGGEEAHLQLAAEVGVHTHGGGGGGSFLTTGGVGFTYGALAAINGSLQPLTLANVGGTPFNIIQPGLVTNKCIRYE